MRCDGLRESDKWGAGGLSITQKEERVKKNTNASVKRMTLVLKKWALTHSGKKKSQKT